MDTDMIADLKQFITATMSQQFAQHTEEINRRFDKQDENVTLRFDEQDEKLNEIMNAVGADLNKHSARIDDHDVRIKRLEKSAA